MIREKTLEMPADVPFVTIVAMDGGWGAHPHNGPNRLFTDFEQMADWLAELLIVTGNPEP